MTSLHTRRGTEPIPGTVLAWLRSDDCVASLARVAEILEPMADAVLACWHREYREIFDREGFFGADAFRTWHREEVRGLFRRLVARNPDALAHWLLDRGRRLRAMRVPFDELVFSINLFEVACTESLAECDLEPAELRGLALRIDQVSHIRIVLLAHAYYVEERHRSRRDRVLLLDEIGRLHRDVDGRDRFCGLVGRTLPMQRLYEQLAAAARANTPVLVVGESGTGKELAAQAIHRLSDRPAERFLPLNCATLPEELIDSELFGHRRGSFSGARQDTQGLFREAHGGTIFLDEITELAPRAQAKLLRALEEQAVRPVGATREEPIDVRVIAATNVPLAEIRSCGRIRRDLYYRLQGYVVEMPPLRERPDDIPLLVQHFLSLVPARAATPARITDAALHCLQAWSWPGNVRELKMLAGRLYAARRDGLIRLCDLPKEMLDHRPPTPTKAHGESPRRPISLQEAERDAIVRALRATRGNKTRASKLLGISRRQLYVKLDRYDIRA